MSKMSIPTWWKQEGLILNKTDKGRGVFATHPFQKGDKIIVETSMEGTKDELLNLIANEEKCMDLVSSHGDELWNSTFEKFKSDEYKSHHYGIIEKNSFSTKSDDCYTICLHISFLNHACVPNCFVLGSFYSRQHSLIALRDIRVGEEITISYISYEDLMAPWMNRQKSLTGWFTQCLCHDCILKINLEDDARLKILSSTERRQIIIKSPFTVLIWMFTLIFLFVLIII